MQMMNYDAHADADIEADYVVSDADTNFMKIMISRVVTRI